MATTPEVTFRHGNPLMCDYTPGSAVNAGKVEVVGDVPLVAHNAIAANELGALAAGGGVYRGTAGEPVDAGEVVFWDDTANKFVATPGANKCFGFCAPGNSAAADGDEIDVVHAPAIAMSGGGSAGSG